MSVTINQCLEKGYHDSQQGVSEKSNITEVYEI